MKTKLVVCNKRTKHERCFGCYHDEPHKRVIECVESTCAYLRQRDVKCRCLVATKRNNLS